MPYAASPTANTIIEGVKREFLNHLEFEKLPLINQDYFDLINEAMDEIYADCNAFQPDNFTINTVVGTYEYPIDGSENNFPAEIDEIIRVDYDGTPLKYRYLYPEQVIEPSSDDSGAPDGWYEKWDGGKRYLGLTSQPDSIVELTAYTTRISQIITATTGVPAIERDYFSLIKYILVAKFARRIKDYRLKDEVIRDEVMPGKRRLAGVMSKRQGRRTDEIVQCGPKHYYY